MSKNSGVRRIRCGTGHRYTIDGVKVVGVTTALRAIPKPQLEGWAARSVAEHVVAHYDAIGDMLAAGGHEPTTNYLRQVPHQLRSQAAVRGTAVHQLAEPLSLGEEITVPDHLAGHVEAYVEFLDRFRPQMLAVETVVGSRKHRYAGTADAVMVFPEPLPGCGWRRVLVDIKTGKSVYGEAALQLAAYRHAEFHLGPDNEEQPMPKVDGAIAVHVREDGYDLVPLNTDAEVFDDFLTVLASYHRVVRPNRQTRRSPLERYVLPPLEVSQVQAVTSV